MKRATTMAVVVAVSLVLAGAARGGVITFGLVEEYSGAAAGGDHAARLAHRDD